MIGQDVLESGKTVATNSGQKGVGCVATEKVVKENVGTVNTEDVEVHTDSSDSGYEPSEASDASQELCLEADREDCQESEEAAKERGLGISEGSTEKEPVQVIDTVTYDVNKVGVVSVIHSTEVKSDDNDGGFQTVRRKSVGKSHEDRIVDGMEYEPRYPTRNRNESE